ncbi:class II aldolase/adducin family protein [Phenylobacterium sp. LjRoot219]|uniref:class II aldolase/adducin family protein n=1 Tax=Phenylobacterium sp. LjRoot219 TaxID=3342283 RepID=UPI003ECDA0E9
MSIARDNQDYAAVIEELVTANHILASEEIVDSFGHISCRDPHQPDRFLLSRARAPALIGPEDIMVFDASGEPIDAQGRRPYIERFIHAAIYAARPDVHSVVHDHSRCVIPFTVSSTPLRPISNSGGPFGVCVPVWDIADKFGDCTNLLVVNLEMGQDLAGKLGQGSSLLLRGHGAVVAAPSIRRATFLAIGLDAQAKLLREALQLGEVTYLSPGEIETTGRVDSNVGADALGRAWEHWCKKTSRPFTSPGF